MIDVSQTQNSRVFSLQSSNAMGTGDGVPVSSTGVGVASTGVAVVTVSSSPSGVLELSSSPLVSSSPSGVLELSPSPVSSSPVSSSPAGVAVGLEASSSPGSL